MASSPTSFSNEQAPAAPQADVGLKAFGLVAIDLVGVYLLAGCAAAVLLYLAYCQLVKWSRERGRMNSVAAGQVRLAAARGNLHDLELMSTLPDFKVDADSHGFTPLHAATVQGHSECVLWLLEHGADIKAVKRDDWNDSVLHYAAGSGSKRTVQVLLEFGADPALRNALNQTPADVARRAGYPKLASYLDQVLSGAVPRPTPADRADWAATPERVSRHTARPATAVKPGLPGSAHNGKLNGKVQSARSSWWQRLLRRPSSDSDAKTVSAENSKDLESGKPGSAGSASSADEVSPEAERKQLAARGWEGWGASGTEPKNTVRWLRPLIILTQFLAVVYIVWRALRTLRPGYGYFYSIPFWLAEFFAFLLSNCFMLSMFYQIDRPPTIMKEMMPESEFPHVDIYVVTYSEPVDIVEPTAIAALNMNWPGSKLSVVVLDDGKRAEMHKMVRRLRFQTAYMQRAAKVEYVCREKVKGVPHHAKAGNINSCLLKEGKGQGEFVLVLDCDMIAHPDFLQRTIGHFYEPAPGGGWKLKPKAAFLQTPQDFWNVDNADPMVHCARFFYGPMLQGRDGIGACPCCGTGVVFRRDCLVALGGQAYGSITEDYNTAMELLGSGFATMFLNERLVYGMAPDDIESVLTQRLRWAMGALQILIKTNPLKLVGLNFVQSILFFEAAAQHYLAISTIFMAVVPVVYMFTQYSPMVVEHLWEFAAVFGAFYLANRVTMWVAHLGCEGGGQELWRGSQMWVWMAPNHIKAIWKVLVAESPLFKWLCNFEITFAVTSKDKKDEEGAAWRQLKAALWCTWPYLVFYAAYFAGMLYWIVTAAMSEYTTWQNMIFLSALAWGILICLCIWPPVWTLVPREETELGWKIKWVPNVDLSRFGSRRRRSLSARDKPQGFRNRQSLDEEAPPPMEAVPEDEPHLQGVEDRPVGASPKHQALAPVPEASLELEPSLNPNIPNIYRAVSFTDAGSKPSAGLEESQKTSSAASGSPRSAGRRELSSHRLDALPEAPQPPARPATAPSPFMFAAQQARPAPATAPSPFFSAAQQARPTAPSPFAEGAKGAPAAGAQHTAASGQQASAASVGMGGGSTAGQSSIAMAVSPRAQPSPKASPAVFARQRTNLGRVGLAGRAKRSRADAALLTSLVLPERDRQGMVSVLLDAEGHFAPAAGVAIPQGSIAVSSLLPQLEGVQAAASPRPSGGASKDSQQMPALRELSRITGAGASGEDIPAISPSYTPQRTARSAQLTTAALPIIVQPLPVKDGTQSLAALQEAALTANITSQLGQLPPDLMQSTAQTRIQQMSQRLFSLVGGMSTAGGSMLQAAGSTMVLPVQPESVFAYTIAAIPNFDLREKPKANYMFLIVNAFLLICLALGSWLDVKTNTSHSTLVLG